jgi:xylulokinase
LGTEGTILALDIGTTALKAGVIDEKGTLLTFVRVPFSTGTRKAVNGSDFGPGSWLSAVRQALRAMRIEKARTLRAVAVCGNGPTLVPMGANGRPVANPLSWMKFSRRTGNIEPASDSEGSIDPSFFLSKVFDFAREFPALYDKTAFFLPCPEYVSYSLTGDAFAILPTGEYGNYYWSDEVISRMGLDMEKFPLFVSTGDQYGEISKAASTLYGISEGTPVIAGGPDFIMSLIGTGTIKAGETCDRAGSSEGINYCSKRETADGRLFCLPHLSHGLYNISAILSASGTSLNWLLRLLSLEKTGYKSIGKMIEDAAPGSGELFFFPHIVGERNTLWGHNRTGAFSGLTSVHGRKEMLRAVVESTGYAIRQIVEAIEGNGLPLQSLRISGGQASSASWSQMRADITGKQVLVPEIIHSELVGCACVAFAALGNFKNFTEAAKSLVRIKDAFRPRKKEAAIYSDLYEKYKKLDALFGNEECAGTT